MLSIIPLFTEFINAHYKPFAGNINDEMVERVIEKNYLRNFDCVRGDYNQTQ